MRLRVFISEDKDTKIITKGIDAPGPEAMEEYTEEEINSSSLPILAALDALRKNGIESDADKATFRDLQLKMKDWDSVEPDKPFGKEEPAEEEPEGGEPAEEEPAEEEPEGGEEPAEEEPEGGEEPAEEEPEGGEDTGSEETSAADIELENKGDYGMNTKETDKIINEAYRKILLQEADLDFSDYSVSQLKKEVESSKKWLQNPPDWAKGKQEKIAAVKKQLSRAQAELQKKSKEQKDKVASGSDERAKAAKEKDKRVKGMSKSEKGEAKQKSREHGYKAKDKFERGDVEGGKKEVGKSLKSANKGKTKKQLKVDNITDKLKSLKAAYAEAEGDEKEKIKKRFNELKQKLSAAKKIADSAVLIGNFLSEMINDFGSILSKKALREHIALKEECEYLCAREVLEREKYLA